MAETGSAPWKGLALGGAVTAVVVALGLWLGGVFDPMRGIEEGAATTGTGGESPATAATTGPVTGQDSTGATTAADQAQQAEAPAQQAQAAQTDQAQADQSRTDQAQADQAQADQAQADQAQSGEAAADAPAAQTSADQAGTATSAAPAPSDTATSDTAASDTTAPARTETASDAATGTRTADAPAAGAEATADSRTQTATDTAAATDTTTPATAAPASGETQQAQATAPQTAPTTGDTSGTSDGTSGSVASAAAPSASGTTGTTTPGTQSMTTRTAATDTAQATATASPQSDTPPAGDTAAAPRFDVVRMETDGAALVAGAAEPGEKVQVLVDGQVVGEETAGGDGKFVAFLDLPSSDASRVVTLRTAREGGEVASTQEVILGPTAKPAPDGDASATTAAAAPTVLLSDRDGVKVLQAPGAGSSDEVSIGAVSYADNGAVTMTGRGLAGALLRVYLDGAPVTESRIAEDGSWTLDLSGIAGGDRLLRIDEIAADGTVRSRVETPFNRDAGATIRTAAADAATTAAAETATPAVAEPAATAQADAATGAPATAAPQPDTETATAAQGGAQDSATTIAATTTAPTAAPVPSITQVTVERGSTLWAIAREKYGEGLMYVRVFEANKDLIRNPDLIYPGQVFHLPD